ncbi:MAG: helix-turn-helix domain-containing protein [Cyclobacteriaceae bacterium]
MSIAENIKYLRKKAGFTQEQFANEVGIKRSLVGAYEEGRAEPRLQTLSKIAEVLAVTSDGLISKDLTQHDALRRAQEKVKILSITVDENDEENIELVPQKAAAGYLNGYADPEYIADLPKFKLPILPKGGTYRAFEIQGDSMLPILPGTIVIGRYMDSIFDIKNGKTYIIISEKEGVVYKRVFNYIDDKGKLFLVSDNKQYSPFELAPHDVQEVWEAKAYISIQFPDIEAESEFSMENLTNMIMKIKDDVGEIKEKL